MGCHARAAAPRPFPATVFSAYRSAWLPGLRAVYPVLRSAISVRFDNSEKPTSPRATLSRSSAQAVVTKLGVPSLSWYSTTTRGQDVCSHSGYTNCEACNRRRSGSRWEASFTVTDASSSVTLAWTTSNPCVAIAQLKLSNSVSSLSLIHI